ncbi:MAG: molybdate ABC transporter substrate-binding protein [Chloroflexi bacterium]|nr:molybdate ABC transporter substrate-binding protein [Chloroflexota bacterium]MCL5075097.1 molybdate ABC transporter substrate-binding protein [Chloroflexota bacterium]
MRKIVWVGTVFSMILLGFALTVTACGTPKVDNPSEIQRPSTGSPIEATTAPSTGKTIVVFAGAASKPALEEAAQTFENKTGTKVELTFGGSGTVLSQMILSKKGDLYIPGTQDFMDTAEKKGVVDPSTRRVIAYLIPSIGVPKGNPLGIKGLADLTRPGVRVGIANPETVCLGSFALEIFDRAGLRAAIEKNIVTQAKSCEDVATLIKLRKVDAVIGWTVFAAWHPHDYESITLPPDNVVKIGTVPVAISKFTKDRLEAERLADFLSSEEGKEIFAKHGYITNLAEARRYAPSAAY